MSVQAAVFLDVHRALPEFLEQRGDEEIYLRGHRITLEEVCYYYDEGCTAEMLRERFPPLALVLIHKVIVFYVGTGAAVRYYLAECQAARDANFEQWQKTPRQTPDAAQLRKRLQLRQTAGGTDL